MCNSSVWVPNLEEEKTSLAQSWVEVLEMSIHTFPPFQVNSVFVDAVVYLCICRGNRVGGPLNRAIPPELELLQEKVCPLSIFLSMRESDFILHRGTA